MSLRLTDIKQRCENPKKAWYQLYGGRGIKCFLTVDDLVFVWVRDKAHLLKQPSVDRIDNDGHYELENIQFIEMGENTAKSNRYHAAIRTQCRRGHPRIAENIYSGPKYRWPICRKCNSLAVARYQSRKK